MNILDLINSFRQGAAMNGSAGVPNIYQPTQGYPQRTNGIIPSMLGLNDPTWNPSQQGLIANIGHTFGMLQGNQSGQAGQNPTPSAPSAPMAGFGQGIGNAVNGIGQGLTNFGQGISSGMSGIFSGLLGS